MENVRKALKCTPSKYKLPKRLRRKLSRRVIVNERMFYSLISKGNARRCIPIYANSVRKVDKHSTFFPREKDSSEYLHLWIQQKYNALITVPNHHLWKDAERQKMWDKVKTTGSHVMTYYPIPSDSIGTNTTARAFNERTLKEFRNRVCLLQKSWWYLSIRHILYNLSQLTYARTCPIQQRIRMVLCFPFCLALCYADSGHGHTTYSYISWPKKHIRRPYIFHDWNLIYSDKG